MLATCVRGALEYKDIGVFVDLVVGVNDLDVLVKAFMAKSVAQSVEEGHKAKRGFSEVGFVSSGERLVKKVGYHEVRAPHSCADDVRIGGLEIHGTKTKLLLEQEVRTRLLEVVVNKNVNALCCRICLGSWSRLVVV
jgi:hypothetical protein